MIFFETNFTPERFPRFWQIFYYLQKSEVSKKVTNSQIDCVIRHIPGGPGGKDERRMQAHYRMSMGRPEAHQYDFIHIRGNDNGC